MHQQGQDWILGGNIRGSLLPKLGLNLSAGQNLKRHNLPQILSDFRHNSYPYFGHVRELWMQPILYKSKANI